MAYVDNDTKNRTIEEIILDQVLDGLGEAVSRLINEAMVIERSRYLKAGPYERSPERKGHSNGFKEKEIKSRAGLLELKVLQVRDGSFYPCSLQKGSRSETALSLAVAQMYVQGVSTRRVTKIVEELCGFEISSSEVSRVSQELDKELQVWRDRPLGAYDYMYLDARYEKVRHNGAVRDCAVLSAIGVKAGGPREVLGVSVALSEAEVHWRSFLESLAKRGLHGLKLIISDDHKGLKNAKKAVFSSVPWQRCRFHLQQNAQAYVPRKSMSKEVAQTIRDIFTASRKEDALNLLQRAVQEYAQKAPELSHWMEGNLAEGLTVFEFPDAHRKKIRTNNPMERLNMELSRRTSVARFFPNSESLLRLLTAIASEISDDWASGRCYLKAVEKDI